MNGSALFIVAYTCAGLALVPAALFFRNLFLYRRLPETLLGNLHQTPSWKEGVPAVSVLIPARNEENNIGPALTSLLQSRGVDFEVVVLDDGSTDRTAEIVESFAADPRVRLEKAPPLPAGWCGKNHACHTLAGHARHSCLIFMDADVRVAHPEALARLAAFFQASGAALVSGVPRQEMEGLMEKMIIPLIHFILLGFLPMSRMRASTDPSYAAACGQILALDRQAFQSIGGYSSVSDRIHDAVALTRALRVAGHKTDLFDATDSFTCRMYHTAADVWHGFAKNAHEGLAAPRLIGPATLLLLGGQVLPLVLLVLIAFGQVTGFVSPWAVMALVFALTATALVRLAACRRFRQPLLSAVLHPLGITLLVAIQWAAFIKARRKQPAVWKGRAYPAG